LRLRAYPSSSYIFGKPWKINALPVSLRPTGIGSYRHVGTSRLVDLACKNAAAQCRGRRRAHGGDYSARNHVRRDRRGPSVRRERLPKHLRSERSPVAGCLLFCPLDIAHRAGPARPIDGWILWKKRPATNPLPVSHGSSTPSPFMLCLEPGGCGLPDARLCKSVQAGP
jgi:hypothetical protein